MSKVFKIHLQHFLKSKKLDHACLINLLSNLREKDLFPFQKNYQFLLNKNLA